VGGVGNGITATKHVEEIGRGNRVWEEWWKWRGGSIGGDVNKRRRKDHQRKDSREREVMRIWKGGTGTKKRIMGKKKGMSTKCR